MLVCLYPYFVFVLCWCKSVCVLVSVPRPSACESNVLNVLVARTNVASSLVV